jgi:glutaredoxin-like protein NrdH
MADVTIYSKDRCPGCRQTKQHLDRLGINYATRNLEDDPSVLDEVKSLGFMAFPVVVTPTGSWSGFDPDKLDAITQG